MITKAYTSVTKLPQTKTPPEPEENMVAVQDRINWLASSVTQAMIAGLKEESNRLLADAADLAMVNHQQENTKLIIQKLVEAKTLQKVIGKYVKVSNP
jgi:hypothetical protein